MAVLVVRVGAAEAEACSDWLFQLGATAIEDRSHDASPVLLAGFGSDDDALAARSILQERWACRLEDTGDEASWRDQWLRHLEPITIGSITVHAPWHDPQTLTPGNGERRLLSIDPGRAFGSGHHPTTRLAIAHLDALTTPHDRVLDVGCGTGILSIVAATAGAKHVTGVDLDHDVLAVAQANAEANDCGDRISLVEAAQFDWSERFDVVVANIVIGDLRPLLGRLAAAATRRLIMTGFLEHQHDELLGDLSTHEIERTQLDGWSSSIVDAAAC